MSARSRSSPSWCARVNASNGLTRTVAERDERSSRQMPITRPSRTTVALMIPPTYTRSCIGAASIAVRSR